MTLAIENLQRLVGLEDTKANITAFAGTPTEFSVSRATDTGEFGIYVGGAWHWIGAASFAVPAIVLGTAAAGGAATTVIRSDSTIVAFDATVPSTQVFGDAAATGAAAVAARRDHVHGMPAAPTSGSGANDHAHVAYETHLSDGSTVTFTLDQVYQPGSVMAWNRTAGTLLGVTEVAPDQAMISAAGTTGDSIDFHYAAELA